MTISIKGSAKLLYYSSTIFGRQSPLCVTIKKWQTQLSPACYSVIQQRWLIPWSSKSPHSVYDQIWSEPYGCLTQCHNHSVTNSRVWAGYVLSPAGDLAVALLLNISIVRPTKVWWSQAKCLHRKFFLCIVNSGWCQQFWTEICDDWKSTVLFLCDEFLEKAVRPVDSSTALVSFSVFHVTVLPLKHEKGLHIFCNLIQLNHF